MSRDLPSGFDTVSEQPVFMPVFFVQINWPSGTTYNWNGYGDYSWNGHTWQGLGTYGTISDIRESSDGQANGVTLQLSGVPNDLLIDALANDSQGQGAAIWATSMARDGTLEVTPYQIFDGLIDICPIQQGPTTSTISLQLEKELVDRRVTDRTRTQEDQQVDYPGDNYFQYVAALSTWTLNWGSAQAAAVTPASVVTNQT